jgi:MFS family permease
MTDLVALWHVFVLAGILGISTAIDAPVRQSFTTEVVGQTDLPNAVSLNSANFNAGRLVGPAISGGLIAAFGTGPSFIVNGLSYLFVIAALMNLNKRRFSIKIDQNQMEALEKVLPTQRQDQISM